MEGFIQGSGGYIIKGMIGVDELQQKSFSLGAVSFLRTTEFDKKEEKVLDLSLKSDLGSFTLVITTMHYDREHSAQPSNGAYFALWFEIRGESGLVKRLNYNNSTTGYSGNPVVGSLDISSLAKGRYSLYACAKNARSTGTNDGIGYNSGTIEFPILVPQLMPDVYNYIELV